MAKTNSDDRPAGEERASALADDKDPTEAPEFKRVLKNLLGTPPKPQSEMKGGKAGKLARKGKSTKVKDSQ